jgi:hypothetical protein
MPALLYTGACLTLGVAGQNPPEPEYTSDFALEFCDQLKPSGGNLYFSLVPGTRLRLEGDDDGDFIEVEIKVLDQTKIIEFEINGQMIEAKTRVVREREWENGELVEVSKNYFARCKKTGDVYYFGEDVDIYEDGEVVSHDGAWLAGEDGAQPGLIMPSVFTLGSRYFQEFAPGVAMDRAKHVETGLVVDTPAGTFENCVRIVETTPLEPGSESTKIYAPGVGLIVDDVVELVEFELDDD